jgi:hypothetical protein
MPYVFTCFCINGDVAFTIVAPKSGLSAMVDKNGDVSHYRKWWMSEKKSKIKEPALDHENEKINLRIYY